VTTSGVSIRIRNTGSDPLVDVVATFPSGAVTFGDVGVGQTSAYHIVGEAYRYAAIRATVNGRERELRPIDYVGEKLLAPGAYTYELSSTNGKPVTSGLELRLRDN
jgi:hypothetical protein